ncbi:hypothetical protein RR46_03758 [Papilio xuthus]|uniref:Uncharacterized protein n=1 Tax=Papilio xuthus TaxID=66420 RepID=A0A194Q232_PAPXU|nr:hypothetical protein RR46_03758 [Papilio xuthus]
MHSRLEVVVKQYLCVSPWAATFAVGGGVARGVAACGGTTHWSTNRPALPLAACITHSRSAVYLISYAVMLAIVTIVRLRRE